MIEKKNLDLVYKNNLEDSIIQYLADIKKIDLRQAMDIYYRSKMAEQVSKGLYGIENMDYKYLVHDMIENESELFK